MLGGLISGAAGLLGGFMQNSANSRAAADTREFNSAQAAENKDFQERMSNTSYQRGTEDMIKAGLNPMLAYTQGGASTPSGAQGAAQQAQYINPITPGIEAYNSTAKQQADTSKTKQDENTSSASEANIKEQTKKTIEDTIKTVLEQEKTKASTENTKAELANIKATLNQIIQATATNRTQATVNSAVAANTNQDTNIKKPQEGFSESALGKYMPFLKGTLDLFNSGANAYQSIRGKK